MSNNKSNVSINEQIEAIGREYNMDALAINGLLCHIMESISKTGINNYVSLSLEAQMDVIKKASASYIEKCSQRTAISRRAAI